MASASGYNCRFPGCTAKYQRKEHLSRHEAQHTRRRVVQCPTCAREFGRSDTLRRHIQTVHGIADPGPQIKHACTHCRNQKIRCEGGPPCSNCQRRGIECSLSRTRQEERAVRPGIVLSTATDIQPTVSHSTPPQPRLRRTEIEDRFVSRYFELFHPHWPFIHRASFIEYETPLLVQSMVVIALWMGGEEEERSKAINLHRVLDTALRQQTEQWDAILLHIISAGMMRGGGILPPDLKPSLAPADADLLRRLVTSCKKLGMFYYPNILARFKKSEPPTYVWVSTEEIKRFNLALYKVCRAFSGSSREGIDSLIDAGRGDTSRWGFSARDLQFPLPRNPQLWNALSAEECFAADLEDVYRHNLDDTLEQEWISTSADVLELVGT
ncbi:hypothetical protein BJX68DRAFT_276450 [Aspergillus pseudodeflectus]|uniref:C2H2 type zinc finger domain protein n=1 Tax=Aspergillus pseudodeflectus TaxID=176178 RepID=A0ABR4K5J4_9EURO